MGKHFIKEYMQMANEYMNYVQYHEKLGDAT